MKIMVLCEAKMMERGLIIIVLVFYILPKLKAVSTNQISSKSVDGIMLVL